MNAPLTPLEAAIEASPELSRNTWRALVHELVDDRPLTIGFVAARAHSGCTTMAAAAALGLAHHLKVEVALLETDLSSPSIATGLALPPVPGVADVLRGVAQREAASHNLARVPQLTVLPAGSGREIEAGEFASTRFGHLLAELRAQNRVVILDLPPLLEEPGGMALLRECNCACLVVRARESRKTDVLEAQAILKDAGVRLLGAILNRWKPEFSRGLG